MQLLELCALLAPDELPIDLLLSQPHRLPEPLATAAQDPLQRHETVAALFAAGVLTKDTGGTARMHRLIQAVTLDHLPEAERKQHITEAVELMAELFPYQGGEPDRWPQCAQLLLHAQTLIDHALAAQLGSPELARLLTSVGIYLRDRGLDRRLARQMHEQALAMYRRLYEGDNVNVANGLNILAIDLGELGEYGRARELHEQALAMRQRLYEGDHPDVAASMNNLAIDLHQAGEHERARELDEQALAMRQRLYEGDHPDVASRHDQPGHRPAPGR